MYKDYRYNSIPEIGLEPNHNLMYIAMNPSVDKGLMRSKKAVDKHSIINIGIYNVATEELTYLFDKNEAQKIHHLLYEVHYDEDKGCIRFNMENGHLINNSGVAKRTTVNQLFIIREGKKAEEFEFWMSTKEGKEKQLIKRFFKKDLWRIDVRHQKIIFVEKHPNELKVETYKWG